MYSTSPISMAPYSGVTVRPPVKLKPCSTGMSSEAGSCSTAHTTSGNTISAPTATGHTSGRLPVWSCLRVAAFDHSTVPTMPTTKAASTHRCPTSQSIVGILMPRLDRNTPGSGWNDWRGAGSVCSRAAQKNSCSSTGMLRSVST